MGRSTPCMVVVRVYTSITVDRQGMFCLYGEWLICNHEGQLMGIIYRILDKKMLITGNKLGCRRHIPGFPVVIGAITCDLALIKI